jgi:hypothetical protein
VWGQERACDAALGVAERLGLGAQRAVVLTDWNNTIVRLEPSGLVAKVGTSHFRDARLESLERELAMAAHLARRGAPVVAPARDVAPGPHESRQSTLTLWEYVEPTSAGSPPASETAAALTAVHLALADYGGSLPPFTLELDDARRLLEPQRSPALPPADRAFLTSVVAELRSTLPAPDPSWRPLHGSPHEANWLMSRRGPLLLDFETACRGPVEWDLAALSDDVVDRFPDADRELISLLRRMRSACVAAKCWVAPERAPELREAAEVHLRLLRGLPVE